MTNQINYGAMMHRALRGLIRELLADVAETGELPGEHHFFVTFDTRHPGAQIAPWLRERYPEDLTIVLQHEFYDLSVSDSGFSVTLSFGEQPETLFIPFDSIVTFADPSVEFGLRFESEEVDDYEETEESPMITIEEDPEDSPRTEAEIVSLDKFRKT